MTHPDHSGQEREVKMSSPMKVPGGFIVSTTTLRVQVFQEGAFTEFKSQHPSSHGTWSPWAVTRPDQRNNKQVLHSHRLQFRDSGYRQSSLHGKSGQVEARCIEPVGFFHKAQSRIARAAKWSPLWISF